MNLQYQVKTMLKEKVALLQKHDSELFGKKVINEVSNKSETSE